MEWQVESSTTCEGWFGEEAVGFSKFIGGALFQTCRCLEFDLAKAVGKVMEGSAGTILGPKCPGLLFLCPPCSRYGPGHWDVAAELLKRGCCEEVGCGLSCLQYVRCSAYECSV